MRRRHTREEYLELVARLREAMPDIALSTDMIVGFPGETGEDFEETLSLTAAVRYHSMFSFKYSPRPNTLALKRHAGRRGGGGEDAADRRAAGAAAGDPGRAVTRRRSGAVEPVLVDSRSRRRDWELSGRTSGNTVVNLRGRSGVDRPDRPGADHGGEPEQPRGEASRLTAAAGADVPGRSRREPEPFGAGDVPCRSK